MLFISGANEKVRMITGAGGANIEWHASWALNTSGAITTDSSGTAAAVTTATNTDIVAAAGASKQKAIQEITASNTHASASDTVEIQVYDGTNGCKEYKATLLAGEKLVLDAVGVWTHYDSNGGAYPAVGNLALQADMETPTSSNLVVTPSVQHFHPGHPKFVCMTTGGATPSMQTPPSYNMTSITDSGAGRLTVTIANDFSSANWCCEGTCEYSSTTLTTTSIVAHPHIRSGTLAAGSVEMNYHDQTTITAVLRDPTSTHTIGLGDL